MADELNTMPAKFGSEYVFVRDRFGNPVIDDGDSMPEAEKQKCLTPTEREALANDRYAWRRDS